MATTGWNGEGSACAPRSVVDSPNLQAAVTGQQASVQCAAVTLVDEFAVIARLATCHRTKQELDAYAEHEQHCTQQLTQAIRKSSSVQASL